MNEEKKLMILAYKKLEEINRIQLNLDNAKKELNDLQLKINEERTKNKDDNSYAK